MEGILRGWGAVVRGTPESPPPPVNPNLNVAPLVHNHALEQLRSPGPQSPSSPHPSSAKQFRSAAPEPVCPTPNPLGISGHGLRPGRAPACLSPRPPQPPPSPGGVAPEAPATRRGTPRGGCEALAAAALSISKYLGRAEKNS